MLPPKIESGLAEFDTYARDNRQLLECLAIKGQRPEALVIACSDSRVAPELLLQSKMGDLFVTRNIANVVPPFGSGEMAMGAVMEYALRHLHLGHIIICGHTDCGGIKALDHPANWSEESHIARWLEYARPAKTKVEASGAAPESQFLATVRENVLLQLENLRSYDPVRKGERAGTVTLHGWVYHLETGHVETYDHASARWLPLSGGRPDSHV